MLLDRVRLPYSQAKPGSKGLRDAEQLDREGRRSWGTGVARQPFVPREPRMGTLRTRKNRRRRGFAGLARGLQLYVNPLVAEQLHAGSAMLSATPILPEQRSL